MNELILNWCGTERWVHLTLNARGVAELWINRSDCHNAFNAQVIEDLINALGQLKQQPGLRAMILRGAGKHFSAGADLNWMREQGRLDETANRADADRLAELMQTLDTLPCPVAVVVQGAAYGGALGLVACADFALGLPSARFCLSEVRLGLIPAVISPYVQRAMGYRHMRHLTLSAEPFGADRALTLDLLHEIVEEEDLEDRLNAWVDQCLANGPEAVRSAKTLLTELLYHPIDNHARRLTGKAIAERRLSAEGQEGLSAFLEKREPNWRQS